MISQQSRQRGSGGGGGGGLEDWVAASAVVGWEAERAGEARAPAGAIAATAGATAGARAVADVVVGWEVVESAVAREAT